MNTFAQRTTKPNAIFNSCSRIPFLQLMHCLKSVRPYFQMFCRSMSTCHRLTLPVWWNFITRLCAVIFVGTSLLGYAQLNGSGKEANASMRNNVREWTHLLLVNTPCWHLHSFCATGVSSGLATRATLTRVSHGRLGEPITRGWTCFWFNFCTVVRNCCWVTF
jgi:hypothetical protein